MGLSCKRDVRSYVHRNIKEYVGNVELPEIDSGFAYVNSKFNKVNLYNIQKLNEKFGEKVITYNPRISEDLPGSINVKLSERLYNIYLAKYGKDDAVYPKKDDDVNYILKAVNILSSDKGKQIFNKGKKNNWSLDKILTELQVPKAQKQIILDKGINDREEIITSLLVNNTFTVEVKKTKDKIQYYYSYNEMYDWTHTSEEDRLNYYGPGIPFNKPPKPYALIYSKDHKVVEYYDTREEADKAALELNKTVPTEDTSFYKNMTVPGGTNYVENEISTPDIIPSTKGHAQFSTDQGIGWFRSDEQAITSATEKENDSIREGQLRDMGYTEQEISRMTEDEINQQKKVLSGSKTRRILEIQSDLFQKERDQEYLESTMYSLKNDSSIKNRLIKELSKQNYPIPNDFSFRGHPYERPDKPWTRTLFKENGRFYQIWQGDNERRKDKTEIQKFEYYLTYFENTKEGSNIIESKISEFKEKFKIEAESKKDENDFLQLLNKKNNWINFFIESIIQDSAKKGYTKVLFPKGRTAAKVEGHQSLEEFLKIKNQRLKELNKKIIKSSKTKKEIETIKKEIADAQAQGESFGSSIYDFYQKTISNILNKKYKGRVKEIVDEYNNTWNEVELTVEDSNNPFVLQMKKYRVDEVESKILKKYLESTDRASLVKGGKDINKVNILNKLFNNKKSDTTSNILRNGLNNLNISKDLSEIAEVVINKSTSKVLIVSPDKLQQDESVAEYHSNTNEILLNSNVLTEANEKYIFETILHESIHELTIGALNNPSNNSELRFRKEMVKVFTDYKKLSKEEMYGFKNTYEFVAEIMSSELFRAHLRDLNDFSNRDSTGRSKSLLQRFLEALKKFLGIKSSTADFNDTVNKILTRIKKTSRVDNKGNNVFHKKPEKSKKNTFKKEIKSVDSIIKDIIARMEGVKAKSRSKRGYRSEAQKKFDDMAELLEKMYKESSNEALFKFTEFANNEILSLINQLDEKNREDEITSDFLTRAKAYISVYESLEDISMLSNRQYNKGDITKEEFNKIKSALKDAKYNFEVFHESYIDIARDHWARQFSRYNNRPRMRRRRELDRQYNKIKPSKNKQDWINDKLEEQEKEIQEEAFDELRSQLELIPMDLGGIESHIFSEKNMSNLLINILSTSIDHVEMSIRDNDIKLRNEYYNETTSYKPKGNTNEKKYGKLVTQDKDGNYYLLDKYSPNFVMEYREQHKLLWEVNEEYGYKSKQSKEQYKKFLEWKNKNVTITKTSEGIITGMKPNDKWLNKEYKKLTPKDKKYLNFLKSKALEADKDTNGYKSLIFNYGDAEAIRLPSIRKTDLDKLLSGKISDSVKDKLGDLRKIREDDTTRGEFVNKMVDLNNKERHLVPIHYRNKIQAKDQSLDLPTIFLMNSSMANEFKGKHDLEADAKLLTDIVEKADVIQTEPYTHKIYKTWFNVNDNEVEVKERGINSNVYKIIKSITENRIYKITEAGTSKFGKNDVATIANNVAGYSAHLALAVNWLSAAPNLLQGKIQNFIEGVGKDTFSGKDLRWAERTYFNELRNGALNDIGSTINHSKLSMLIDKFNLMGDYNVIKNKFEDSTKFRAMFKSSTLHGFNNIAEHYVQSTLMLAILHSVKVKNKDGDYISKEGKVVSKDKAMNLYDAFELKDNILVLSDKADHTSFSRESLKDLGMLQHQSLIRKKVIDLQGQYDNRWQSNIQRYWYGKLGFMFRKWLVPSYNRRWKGFYHFRTGSEQLTENQLNYDDSLQKVTEGMYTSFMRFIYKGIIPGIKELRIDLIKSNWNNLTDHEKANVIRTSRELLTMVMMMTAAAITHAAAKDTPDEDDKKVLYTLAYIFKRQETELMQYYNPVDQMRIFRTPFAAMSTLEKSVKWLNQIMPWNIGEEYERGDNTGEYKAWVMTKRMIPAISQTERSAKNSLSYLSSISD